MACGLTVERRENTYLETILRAVSASAVDEDDEALAAEAIASIVNWFSVLACREKRLVVECVKVVLARFSGD